MQVLFVLFVICVKLVCAKFYKTNITDFAKCDTYFAESTLSYNKFYEIEKQPVDNALTIDLHFSVLGAENAHILLSPSDNVTIDDPVYEIVLGAGANTYSVIRRLQKKSSKGSVGTTGLLSLQEIRSFWIHIDKHGLVGIGREEEDVAFLVWQDSNPLPIKYFSFSSWEAVDVKFFFNCPRHEEPNDIKEVPNQLTGIQKLKMDLLTNYDNHVRPVYNVSKSTDVTFSLGIERIILDEKEAALTIHGTTNMTWKDEKLIWDPTLYDNISNIILLDSSKVWVPKMIFNTTLGAIDIMQFKNLFIQSSGLVNLKSMVHFTIWCTPKNPGHWPSGKYSCRIEMGFGRDSESIVMQNENVYFPFSNSEWLVHIEDARSVQSKAKKDPAYMPGTHLIIERREGFYTTIYFTPLIVIFASLLTTFWISPRSTSKVVINCLQILLLFIILLVLVVRIPVHSTTIPNIVLLYSYGLMEAVVSLAVSVLVINLSRTFHSKPLPYFLTAILSMSFLRNLFCISSVKNSEPYDKLEESTPTNVDDSQEMWIYLSQAVDRTAFILFFIFSVITLSVHY